MSTLISVVIPTCDRPIKYVKKAVQSVLDQSLSAHEIILVDNGTVKLLENDWPSNIKIIRTEARIGPSRARNIGAMAALGSHIAFLDDDDWWDENFLLEAYDVLKSEKTKCVYGRIIHQRDGCQQSSLSKPTCSLKPLNLDILLRKNPGTGGINLLVDKVLFLQIGGFDENLFVSEDRSFAIDVLLSNNRISLAPKAIAFARLHDGESLRKNNTGKIKFVFKYRKVMPLALFLKHLLKFGFWIYVRPRRRR